MSLTKEEANARLKDINTPEELRELLENLSVETSGNKTLLVSGNSNINGNSISTDGIAKEIKDNYPDIRVIKRTDAYDFLDLKENKLLRETLRRIYGTNPRDRDTTAGQFIGGTINPDGSRNNDGAWDIVSRRFVEETKGEVIFFIGESAKEERVFFATELDAIVKNENITSVNSVPHREFQQRVETTDKASLLKELKEETKRELSSVGFEKMEDVDRLISPHLSSNKTPIQAYLNQTTSNIIEALESGTAPWLEPWSGEEIRENAPFNPITGREYEGVDAINLTLKGKEMGGDPRWITESQAQSLNAQVREGEEGLTIPYLNSTKESTHPEVSYVTLFNASQIDGLKPLKEDIKERESRTDSNPIERAKEILNNSHANILHTSGERAYYSSEKDTIHLPLKEQFSSEMDYYSTALHQLGDWSGHESRLNRDIEHPFGSVGHAKEELRTELGSYLLSSKIGIDFNPSQHHSHVDNWVSILKESPDEISQASSDASKIVNFITQPQKEQRSNLMVSSTEKGQAEKERSEALKKVIGDNPSDKVTKEDLKHQKELNQSNQKRLKREVVRKTSQNRGMGR